MDRPPFVIVGASLAGASAAAALRKEGHEGRILLIGEEDHRPYERPDLSKKYLRGEPDAHLFVHGADFYAGAGIELRTSTRVDRIDTDRREVVADGERIAYERLLLATGVRPRHLGVPGDGLDGVLSLRTIDDADRIRARALAAAPVVVVGGGWIGAEVAASLRQLRYDVTLVLPTEMPLERVLGREIGAVYRDVHVENGVRLIPGVRVAAIRGDRSVRAVVLDDGREIPAGLVVVGIGAEPRTELAEQAGVAVDRGILVDARLESSVPGVFAAGDVANAWHPLYRRRLRVEHRDNAKRQGRTAAATMLGWPVSYDRIPFFYSDQFDLGMEYTGLADRADEILFRGDPASRGFIAFWLRDGRVTAGMNVNVWDVAASIERLVRSGGPVDRMRLADPDVPLDDIVPGPSPVPAHPVRSAPPAPSALAGAA